MDAEVEVEKRGLNARYLLDPTKSFANCLNVALVFGQDDEQMIVDTSEALTKRFFCVRLELLSTSVARTIRHRLVFCLEASSKAVAG